MAWTLKAQGQTLLQIVLSFSRVWEQYFSSVFESSLPHLTLHAWLQPNYGVFPRVWRAFKISRSSIEQLWPFVLSTTSHWVLLWDAGWDILTWKRMILDFLCIYPDTLYSPDVPRLWDGQKPCQSSAELCVMWKKLFPLSRVICSLLSCRRYLLFLH